MKGFKLATLRAFGLVVAVAALLLPAMLVAQTAGPGRQAYLKGKEAAKRGDHNGAIQAYNEAIAVEKTNFRYFYDRGQSEMKLKKFNEAVQSFRQAAVLNKDIANPHVKMAVAYIQLRNYPGAAQALNAAYDVEKDANKKLQYKLAAVNLLLKQNRPQEAQAELNKVKSTAGEDPRVLAVDGDILVALNNYTGAVTSYQRAIDRAKAANMNPNQVAKYWYSLGVAYYKAGDQTKANEAWKNVAGTPYQRRVAAFQATSGAGYQLRIASGYLKANVLEDAITYANKAIQLEPNNYLGYMMLANIQSRKGQVPQAIANLNKAADQVKDEAKRTKVLSSIINLQFRNGDYAGALATADKILAKTPNNPSVLGIKAQAEYQLGRYPAAVATAERAIAAANNNANLVAAFQFTQALAAKKAGDNEKAKKLFGTLSSGKSQFKFAARTEMEKLSAR